MAMDYIKLREDAIEDMELLSDAECGRLVRALLQYKRTKQVPELSGNERVLFPALRRQIDSDEQAYEEKSQKNRRSALKRWEQSDANACECMQTHAFAYEEKREIKEIPPTPPKENKEKKEKPPIAPHGGERAEDFALFWQAYPRKVGKHAAIKAWAKLDVPLDTLLSALEAQKRSEQWQRDNGQYIPYPATWLNGRRWEDEIETERQNDNGIQYFEQYQR